VGGKRGVDPEFRVQSLFELTTANRLSYFSPISHAWVDPGPALSGSVAPYGGCGARYTVLRFLRPGRHTLTRHGAQHRSLFTVSRRTAQITLHCVSDSVGDTRTPYSKVYYTIQYRSPPRILSKLLPYADLPWVLGVSTFTHVATANCFTRNAHAKMRTRWPRETASSAWVAVPATAVARPPLAMA